MKTAENRLKLTEYRLRKAGGKDGRLVLRVAICDDSALARELLAMQLKQYCNSRALVYSCTQFENGNQLCYELSDGGWFDIVFLDIYMEPALGIDVARRLRESAYSGQIIFCTAALDFAPESFEVGASGYLLKPSTMEAVARTMDRVLGSFAGDTFVVKSRSKFVRIPLQEILYVESENTKCLLHRANGEQYAIYRKLSEIEKELAAPCFLRCHQSYLVNMNYIQSADGAFTLTNGETVLIRKKNLKALRERYFAYREMLTAH